MADTERAVVESSSVRLDADSVELSVSTKGVVTCTVKVYGDWSAESQANISDRLQKGIESFKQDGRNLAKAFHDLNGQQ